MTVPEPGESTGSVFKTLGKTVRELQRQQTKASLYLESLSTTYTVALDELQQYQRTQDARIAALEAALAEATAARLAHASKLAELQARLDSADALHPWLRLGLESPVSASVVVLVIAVSTASWVVLCASRSLGSDTTSPVSPSAAAPPLASARARARARAAHGAHAGHAPATTDAADGVVAVVGHTRSASDPRPGTKPKPKAGPRSASATYTIIANNHR